MPDQPLSIVNSEPLTVVQAQPLGSERTRVDTNAVGVDHDKIVHGIADWASKLPPAWQKPAAMLATFPADALASLLEMFSAPETIASAGAAKGLTNAPAAVERYPGTPLTERINAAGRALEQLPEAGVKTQAIAKVLQKVPARQAAELERYRPNVSAYPGELVPRAAVAPVEPTPAPAPSAQPGPRSVNDAMAEAVRQVQEKAKAERAAVTARGASAPAAPGPSTAPATQSPPSPAPPTALRPAPGKPSVTAQMLTQYQKLRTLGLKDAEMPTYLRLTQQGTSEAEALQTIEAMRTLSAKLPSASDVARTVADRNATGKWRE